MGSSPSIDQVGRVVFPVNLGPASGFDRAIFPLYRKRGSLGLGDLYLEATLDEMLKIKKIKDIGNRPQQWQEILDSAKDKYDELRQLKEDLEQLPKSKNPFKRFSNFRTVRMFLASSRSLYNTTKSRSDELIRSGKRNLLSISAEDGQPVDDDVSPDENIEGISVIIEHPLDDITTQQLLDVGNTIASYSSLFEDEQMNSSIATFHTAESALASESLLSLAADTEETSANTTSTEPSSPTVIQNYYNFYGSIYAPGSNLYGPTSHSGGNNNSGAVAHTTIRPNDT